MVNKPEDIFQFLPINYYSPIESEYVSFWWDTYSKNVEDANYHVAFLAFHFLYMTAVYFLLYKISKVHGSPYKHSLFHMGNEEEAYYLAINSPFSFSQMNEKGVFRFLKIAGADYSLIGEVSKFINARNNAAHAKGAIFFKNDPDGLELRAVEYVQALEKIQKLCIPDTKNISKSWKISKLNGSALKLYVEGEILNNSLSPAEIKEIADNERAKRPRIAFLLDEILAR